jgi:hypothetical protein
MKKLPANLDPSKFNLGNVIQGRSGKSINRTLQEMIYNTKFAKRPAINIQGQVYIGEYYNSRFHYELPPQWHNSATYNRSMGLRNIRALLKQFSINLYLYIWITNSMDQGVNRFDIRLHFTPQDDTNEVFSQLIFQMNAHAQESSVSGTWINFLYGYMDNTIYIGSINNHNSEQEEVHFSWVLGNDFTGPNADNTG